jgi:hypothetical protein
MAGQVARDQYPSWVQAAVWGLPNRPVAWAVVWMCTAAAIGCVAYAFLAPNPHFFVGASLFLSALWYWLAIRWVDRHGSWERQNG